MSHFPELSSFIQSGQGSYREILEEKKVQTAVPVQRFSVPPFSYQKGLERVIKKVESLQGTPREIKIGGVVFVNTHLSNQLTLADLRKTSGYLYQKHLECFLFKNERNPYSRTSFNYKECKEVRI